MYHVITAAVELDQECQTNVAKSVYCKHIHQMAAQVQTSIKVFSVEAFTRGPVMTTHSFGPKFRYFRSFQSPSDTMLTIEDQSLYHVPAWSTQISKIISNQPRWVSAFLVAPHCSFSWKCIIINHVHSGLIDLLTVSDLHRPTPIPRSNMICHSATIHPHNQQTNDTCTSCVAISLCTHNKMQVKMTLILAALALLCPITVVMAVADT